MFINKIVNAKYIYDPKELKIYFIQKIIFLICLIQWNYNNENEKKLNSKINIESLNLQIRKSIFIYEKLKSGLSEFNYLK